MRRFGHLDGLERDETAKERLARYFWDGLCILIGAGLAWDLSVYAIGFWDRGSMAKIIATIVLALGLAALVWLAYRAKSFWWAVAPMVAALSIPVVLRFIGA
jgi:uncharacterized membrane protein YccC